MQWRLVSAGRAGISSLRIALWSRRVSARSNTIDKRIHLIHHFAIQRKGWVKTITQHQAGRRMGIVFLFEPDQ